MNRKEILVSLAVVVGVVVGASALGAFEAHIVNVTAKIENALSVSPSEIEYGTVFPQEKLDQTVSVVLSESFVEAAVGDLIENGGFEQPVVTDPELWDIFPSGTSGLAWTVEWEPSVPGDYGGTPRPDLALKELQKGVNGWLPAEGSQHAELDTDWDGPGGGLNGEPALVRIYQDVPTLAGRTYELSYYYSPRPDVTNAADNELIVRVDGVQVDTHSAAGNGTQTEWTRYSYIFTADSSTTRIEFAAGGTANSLGVFLDGVSLTSGSVNYVVRQKPKCVDEETGEPVRVRHAGDVFECPPGSTMMPLLCPYLSKEEQTEDGAEGENDGPALSAFHGSFDAWTPATTTENEVEGRLSAPAEDVEDRWLIDLDVPCFEGMCAQDWEHEDWELPVEYESDIFGCDLWIEVTGFGIED